MKIELCKIDGKSHRVTITRKDDATESVILDTHTYFLHDLCHYCVEKALGYEKGFWGMLAAGYHFSELNGKQNPLTEELRFIEKIVGPVQSIVSGHIPMGKFHEVTTYLHSDIAVSLPVEQVVQNIHNFQSQWQRLPYEISLCLEFGEEG